MFDDISVGGEQRKRVALDKRIEVLTNIGLAK